jgi:hypothetical protein
MKRRTYVVVQNTAVSCADDTIHVTMAGFRARLGFVKHAFGFVPYQINKIMILLAISEASTFCQEERRWNAELRQWYNAPNTLGCSPAREPLATYWVLRHQPPQFMPNKQTTCGCWQR